MNKCVARAFLADADPPTFSLSSSFFFFLSKTISTARHVRNTRVPGKEEPRTLKKEPQRWTTPGRPPRPLTSSFVAYLSPPQLPAPPKRDTKSWLEGSKGKHVHHYRMSEYLFIANAPARHVLLFCSKHDDVTCQSVRICTDSWFDII